ncbi:unnamed protein product [Gadus morhua 'NCC']
MEGVTPEDGGLYRCRFVTATGKTTANVTLTVTDAGEFRMSDYVKYLYIGGGAAGFLLLLSVFLVLLTIYWKKKRREESRLKGRSRIDDDGLMVNTLATKRKRWGKWCSFGQDQGGGGGGVGSGGGGGGGGGGGELVVVVVVGVVEVVAGWNRRPALGGGRPPSARCRSVNTTLIERRNERELSLSSLVTHGGVSNRPDSAPSENPLQLYCPPLLPPAAAPRCCPPLLSSLHAGEHEKGDTETRAVRAEAVQALIDCFNDRRQFHPSFTPVPDRKEGKQEKKLRVPEYLPRSYHHLQPHHHPTTASSTAAATTTSTDTTSSITSTATTTTTPTTTTTTPTTSSPTTASSTAAATTTSTDTTSSITSTATTTPTTTSTTISTTSSTTTSTTITPPPPTSTTTPTPTSTTSTTNLSLSLSSDSLSLCNTRVLKEGLITPPGGARAVELLLSIAMEITDKALQRGGVGFGPLRTETLRGACGRSVVKGGARCADTAAFVDVDFVVVVVVVDAESADG